MDYYDEFYIECEELFDEAEKALMDLSEFNSTSKQHNWLCFLRVVHSVKGSASMFDRATLSSHCHRIEDFCSTINDISSVENIDGLMRYLFRFIDTARTLALRPQSDIDFTYLSSIEQVIKGPALLAKSKKSSEIEIEFVIVDDEPVFLDLIAEVVGEVSSSFTLFSDPVKACAYIKTHPQCVVVSDFNMPKLNGLQLFEEVQKDFPVPFLFITASNDDVALMELINRGVFGVMKKPFKSQELTYNLTQLLRFAQQKYVASKSLKHLVCHFDTLSHLYKKQNKEFLLKELKQDIDFLLSST